MDILYNITDNQYNLIKDILSGKQTDPGRSAQDNRKFISAVMWISRTGHLGALYQTPMVTGQ